MLTLVCDEGGGWPRGLWVWEGPIFGRTGEIRDRLLDAHLYSMQGRVGKLAGVPGMWCRGAGVQCVRVQPIGRNATHTIHLSAQGAKLYFSADGEAAVRNPFTRMHPPQTKHSTGALRRAARDKWIPARTFSRSPMCNSSNILRVWWDGRTNGAIWLSVSPRYGS